MQQFHLLSVLQAYVHPALTWLVSVYSYTKQEQVVFPHLLYDPAWNSIHSCHIWAFTDQ